MVRKKLSKRDILIGAAWTLIVIFILTFYIWNQIESIRLGYKIGHLEVALENLKKEVEKLEAEKSSLLSLEKVEKIAKDKLKLKHPKKEQIIYDDDKLWP
jgi:cell division protein FtsL